jgi:UDP-N-acetylglucosamine--N-acetylmuramyl-(pentapeptide) pyrophosphoryl-undecaprenol N-acetylglucosamine transferase
VDRPTEVTGTPVRRELLELPDRYEALKSFGLDPARPVVLVVGGSQGAQKLNSIVLEASAELGPEVQWLHVAGGGDVERVRKEAQGREHYVVLGFCDDMASAYAVADLVVCRSGASSLSELARLGLPAILVPYPYAADDHQTANAEAFVEKGAALLMPEGELDGAGLAGALREVLENDEDLRRMTEGMRTLSVDDAAGRICDEIEEGMGS